MSTTSEANSGAGRRRQSRRLQRKAPASLNINPVKEWNVAIPLLSPLVQSPVEGLSSENKSREDAPSSDGKTIGNNNKKAEHETNTVIQKWQHLAATFCCDQAPIMHSFVPA